MPSSTTDLRDRFLGCLLGCAVGDALGAPYEGLWSASIPAEEVLLAGFAEVEGYPNGQYTDDTQLSVATVESIVEVGDISSPDIARSIARLWKNQSVVGPGGACTHAATTFLKTGDWMTCGATVGQAGNGTAMRTAVLGLFFLNDPEQLPAAAANVSKITHQDMRSIAGGVAIAKAAQLLVTDRTDSSDSFCEAIACTMAHYEPGFAAMVRRLPELVCQDKDEALRKIAWAGVNRPEFDQPIITPFVIPTVLASLWSLLRSRDSWSNAVATAIRLGGDTVTMPLYAAIWRAAIGASTFSIYLVGPTGSGKSVLAALAQQHFGATMNFENLPASWSSTANALEGLAFLLKDVLFVIDDWLPRGSQSDVNKANRDADRVFRAQGNHSGRIRSNRDGTPMGPRPPRGQIVGTGEAMPEGTSMNARCFRVEVNDGDILLPSKSENVTAKGERPCTTDPTGATRQSASSCPAPFASTSSG